MYEYWLFFELRKIISEIDDCSVILQDEADSFIKENNGLTISLCQDKKSVQHFETEKQKIDLYYNRTFRHKDFNKSKYDGSYSRPFRPDYTIAIFPNTYDDENKAIEDGAVSYIHFDAKYRLEDLSQFINKNESEDEINKEISIEKSESVMDTYKRGDLLKMHTYNDAIRRTVGSYVLYPGTDNKDGKCFSIYEEILPGVGAFAIRPSDVNNKELNAGEKAVQDFIKEIIDFNANPASRNARTDYFDKMIMETPGLNEITNSVDSKLTMIGYVRPEYYNYLINSENIITRYKNNESDIEFFFYYHAIKKGKVYTLHKETNKANYLRLTMTDYYHPHEEYGKKYVDLEPIEAEIVSSELVSKEKLKELLKQYPGKNDFQADYYYLVKARVIGIYDKSGITSISTDENDIISPYSPKIVQLPEGRNLSDD